MGKRQQKAGGRVRAQAPAKGRRQAEPADDEERRTVIRQAIAGLQAMENGTPWTGGPGTRSKVAGRKRAAPDTDVHPHLAALLSTILAGKQQAAPPPPRTDSAEQTAAVALTQGTSTPSGQGSPSHEQEASGASKLPTRVLICGHSIVFWARKRAMECQFGSQLQLGENARVDWVAKRGMRWAQLIPAVTKFLTANAPPQVLIIHLGENDLTQMTGLALRKQACTDIATLQTMLPGSKIIWSELLQRRVWRGATSVPRVERARRKVNHEIGTFVRGSGGSVIRHPRILHSNHALFRDDGVHLSVMGAEIFLTDLQHGLRGLLLPVGQGEAKR